MYNTISATHLVASDMLAQLVPIVKRRVVDTSREVKEAAGYFL